MDHERTRGGTVSFLSRNAFAHVADDSIVAVYGRGGACRTVLLW